MGAEQKKSWASRSSSQDFAKPTNTSPSFAAEKPSACRTSSARACLFSLWLPLSGWANSSTPNKPPADKKPQEPGKDRLPVRTL